jgi:hypothetical protein
MHQCAWLSLDNSKKLCLYYKIMLESVTFALTFHCILTQTSKESKGLSATTGHCTSIWTISSSLSKSFPLVGNGWASGKAHVLASLGWDQGSAEWQGRGSMKLWNTTSLWTATTMKAWNSSDRAGQGQAQHKHLKLSNLFPAHPRGWRTKGNKKPVQGTLLKLTVTTRHVYTHTNKITSWLVVL